MSIPIHALSGKTVLTTCQWDKARCGSRKWRFVSCEPRHLPVPFRCRLLPDDEARLLHAIMSMTVWNISATACQTGVLLCVGKRKSNKYGLMSFEMHALAAFMKFVPEARCWSVAWCWWNAAVAELGSCVLGAGLIVSTASYSLQFCHVCSAMRWLIFILMATELHTDTRAYPFAVRLVVSFTCCQEHSSGWWKIDSTKRTYICHQ